ncbi:hypothetical protein THAOC_20393, partial [Thalassiosira oceanica]
IDTDVAPAPAPGPVAARRTRSSPRGVPAADASDENENERLRGTVEGEPVMPIPSDPVLNPPPEDGGDADPLAGLPASVRSLPPGAAVDVYDRATGRVMRGRARVGDLPAALARNPGWEAVAPGGGSGR